MIPFWKQLVILGIALVVAAEFIVTAVSSHKGHHK